jgi:plasmid stabilization system protein ParE
MKPYVLHPEALSEFEDACRFLQRKSVELRDTFRGRIIVALEKIIYSPERWPLYDRAENIRSYLEPKHRYRIYYQIETECVLVLAIAHPSKPPGYWRERL